MGAASNNSANRPPWAGSGAGAPQRNSVNRPSSSYNGSRSYSPPSYNGSRGYSAPRSNSSAPRSSGGGSSSHGGSVGGSHGGGGGGGSHGGGGWPSLNNLPNQPQARSISSGAGLLFFIFRPGFPGVAFFVWRNHSWRRSSSACSAYGFSLGLLIELRRRFPQLFFASRVTLKDNGISGPVPRPAGIVPMRKDIPDQAFPAFLIVLSGASFGTLHRC